MQLFLRAWSIPVTLVGLLCGCGSSPSSASMTPLGSGDGGGGGGGEGGSSAPVSEERAFSYITNLIPVTVTEGSTTATGFVDTGNPFVLLNPATFTTTANLNPNGQDVPSLILGSQTVDNVDVVPTSDGLSSPDPAFPLAANVGCAAIGTFVASFNYRDATFALGTAAASPPSGLGADTAFAFAFEGGSTSQGVTIPKSRVVVDVSLEGTTYSMIVDTGASSVTVSQKAFSAITQDGRAQLAGGTAETTTGTSQTSLTRVATIAVGGVTSSSVVIAHDTSFDTNLEAISSDVGHTIDGSLGGTFLHDYYLTIDYPNQQIHLARYTDVSFALDPGERVGVSLGITPQGVYVAAGASGDAANQGVTAGDVIVSIDGYELSSLSVSQVGILLFGPVGSTRTFTFGAATNLTNRSVAIAIEEQLPLPAGK